ncbi:MAG: 5'-nucleotidase C-terminal domain-containing protein, partial [Anaerolineae bacterium]
MLRLVRGMPNPAGAEGAELYLFAGDATAAPIHEVIPADDVVLPQRLPDLAENPLRLSILHFGDLHGSLSNLTPAPGGHLSPAPGGHLSPAPGGHLSPAPGGHLSPAPGGHLSPAPRGRSVDHGSEPSFSRIVWRVRQVRRESRNDPHHAVLFLSGGDDLGGAVYDELLGDDVDSYRVHAGYHLYSAAGVDAGVVGNHDFDQGVALLAHAIERDARFPLLSANLTAPALADRLHPAALLVVKGLRIGLVGLTTPAEIKHRGEAGLRVTHPLVAARNLLPALRPLCDVLIILSHLGHSLGATTAPTRDAGDVELASSMPPDIVHLIIGAHTHTALNETGLEIENIVNNIPIVEAGPMGRYLGEVELAVGDRAAVTSVRLNPAANLPADYHFERREVWPLLDQLEPILARPLGRIADHPDLTTAAVRNQFAAGESALANLIADALVAGCRDAGYPVDLAAIDASSAYHGLPAGGELTFGDWFQVMPFADTVRICPLTGKE